MLNKKISILLSLLLLIMVTGCYPETSVHTYDGNMLDVVDHVYLYQIAAENVPGKEITFKTGYNGDVGVTTETIIPSSNVYTWPAAAQQMSVVSTSANDDLGNTGVNSIRIYYLDSTYTEYFTDVIMDGLNPVLTSVSDIYRINYIRMTVVGTAQAAVGNIYVQNIAGTETYGMIESTRGSDRSLVYTVPKNKTLYITSARISAGSGNKLAVVRCGLVAKWNIVEEIPSPNFETAFEFILQDTAIYLPFEIPLRFEEGTDITGFATSDVTGAKLYIAVRGWLEEN